MPKPDVQTWANFMLNALQICLPTKPVNNSVDWISVQLSVRCFKTKISVLLKRVYAVRLMKPSHKCDKISELLEDIVSIKVVPVNHLSMWALKLKCVFNIRIFTIYTFVYFDIHALFLGQSTEICSSICMRCNVLSIRHAKLHTPMTLAWFNPSFMMGYSRIYVHCAKESP